MKIMKDGANKNSYKVDVKQIISIINLILSHQNTTIKNQSLSEWLKSKMQICIGYMETTLNTGIKIG